MNNLENNTNNLIKTMSEGNLIKTDNISDGYHTFGELYEFRKLYNAMLFNEWSKLGVEVYKTKKHEDGELCFGGDWFLVVAHFPNGDIIDNHYELKDWNLFKIQELEKSKYPFDGHTAEDVKNIMLKHIKEDY